MVSKVIFESSSMGFPSRYLPLLLTPVDCLVLAFALADLVMDVLFLMQLRHQSLPLHLLDSIQQPLLLLLLQQQLLLQLVHHRSWGCHDGS